MLIGEPHHVVHLASPERWDDCPSWARGQRDEIVARIRSQLKEPGYLYQVGADPAPAPAAASGPLTMVTRSQRRAMRALAVGLALCAVLMGIVVWQGLASGEIWWPATQASARRMVSRTGDPLLFWTALSLYIMLGVGSMGALEWGRRSFRARRPD